MNPKVFISYAGEDRNFVLPFARRLRTEMGVDAWVAEWEIASGDSLVRKIFDKGLGEADAVIIILSKHSVDKDWVRAELDVAKVREIKEQTKLIPVVIDDCEIPMALRAVRREREDLQSYDSGLHRIALSVHGMYERPPLGQAPAYTQIQATDNSELARVDDLVLKLLCEEALERDSEMVHPSNIVPKVEELGIPESEFDDALEMLDANGYIEAVRVNANFQTLVAAATITPLGFKTYATTHLLEYPSLYLQAASLIENEKFKHSGEIAEAMGHKGVMAEFILGVLTAENYITVGKLSNGIMITSVTPKLRRMLQQA